MAFLYVTISIYEPTGAYSNVPFRPDVTSLVIADVIRKLIPAIATKITNKKRRSGEKDESNDEDRDNTEMETLTEDQNFKRSQLSMRLEILSSSRATTETMPKAVIRTGKLPQNKSSDDQRGFHNAKYADPS